MSHLPQEKVFRGFWIDHAKGDILGATITTSSNTATVVVAFLSVLIKFAGTNLWQIIALIAFRAAFATTDRNILHRQHQILLRNVTSPAMMLPKAWRLRQHWRRQHITDQKSFARLDLLAYLAGLCSAGFVIAGVLSSQIVSNTNIEVLVHSSSCGFYDFGTASDYSYAAIEQGIEYARQCYNGSRSDPTCQVYTTQSVPVQTSYEVCPFDGLCQLSENEALNMDTGLLWSNDVFGLNVLKADGLAMRQVTKCAPLNLSRYEETAPMVERYTQSAWKRKPLPNELMTTFNISGPEDPLRMGVIWSSSIMANSSPRYDLRVHSWYEAGSDYFEQSPWYLGLSFDPLPPFRKTEGDLAVMTLNSGQHFYQSPVDDPFYAAHIAHNVGTTDQRTSQNQTLYGADSAISMIGCTQQYQFCISENTCTRLTYAASATSEAAQMHLNPLQNVTLYVFANALIQYSVGYNSLSAGLSPPLLAFNGRTHSITEFLPPNQWQLEVKYWTAIILATLQKSVSEFAVGHDLSESEIFEGQSAEQHIIPPGPEEHLLCHALKMKAPNGISNINVFGLGLTVGFSGLVIVANLTLVSLLRCLSKSNEDNTAVKQWDEEEILQVQRKLLESNNTEVWTNSIDDTSVDSNYGNHDKEESSGFNRSSPRSTSIVSQSVNIHRNHESRPEGNEAAI